MAKKWTKDELMVALGLYCKLPFGQFHSKNPLIIEVAESMGRSANSLAMPSNALCNSCIKLTTKADINLYRCNHVCFSLR